MIVIDFKRDPIPFFPPIYSVHIPGDLVNAGVRVIFSDFSIPPDVNLGNRRGIANIYFVSPTAHKGSSVILRVYITFEEFERDDVDIYELKHNGWTRLHAQKTEFEFMIFAGYLEAEFQVGDPPIAVG
jgi:hypothetical protein